MCGISGVYYKNGNVKELKDAVEKMNNAQSRRGPDDEGLEQVEKEPIVIFGHRRLSILDLSKAGHQPMIFNIRTSDVPNINWGNSRTSDVQKLAITFNGEIYNFLELRKELEKKKYKFKTKTDTEVILALYAEHGEKSFSMLRGMFAFGLYDGKNRKLFLVKDRYGIKPLYYYSDKNQLLFSSTVKALEKSGLFTPEKNPEAMIGFLLFGSVPLPLTTLKNVLAVPSGHYLVKEHDKEAKLLKYYEPLDYFQKSDGYSGTSDVPNINWGNFRTSDVQNIIRDTRHLLEESVNLHLISDAPLGVFLSGGLDSSALSVIAALKRKNPITTVSIIFDEEKFSEKNYQRRVAEKIKSDHKEIKITKEYFENSFEEIFEAMDQPTIDGVNSFFVAKAAKEAGLKAVLSGLGGDEVFYGYPSFKKAALLRKTQKLLSIFGRRTSIGRLTSRILSLFGDRYQKISYFLNNDILSFYLGIRGLFAPHEVAKILGISIDEVNNFIDELIKLTNLQTYKLNNLHPADLLSYLELKFYLQNQLLKDADFMSMHHSIEVRVPFLDHVLVEYLSGLPVDLKLNLGTSDVPNINQGNSGTSDVQNINKPLLAEAVRDIVPPDVINRKKMGFTFPFQKWLKEVNSYSFNKLLNNSITKSINNSLTKTHWSRFWANVVIQKFK